MEQVISRRSKVLTVCRYLYGPSKNYPTNTLPTENNQEARNLTKSPELKNDIRTKSQLDKKIITVQSQSPKQKKF
ncbi:hypothetical protein Cantr_01841 [Candida viswanathii]|uniref:Uncharacterized protein n=1 Tax=Candida viswanathii TaxID=5486 RepID=A0A367YK13_9ASCO|nr:hypothetical protein Cantr_01841 [Candida viswanathii]